MRIPTLALAIGTIGSMLVGMQEQQPSFDALLGQVKKGDAKADFLKLRMAFTQTRLYKPYDADADKTAKEMDAALEAKDYKAALKLAERILQSNYVDVNAHMVAARAGAELNNAEDVKHHRYVADGVLRSILTSGNGKGPTTAYVVISVDEEIALLGALGIEKKGQQLITEKDQRIDQIRGHDTKTNQPVTLYFNVTVPFNWLVQHQKGK